MPNNSNEINIPQQKIDYDKIISDELKDSSSFNNSTKDIYEGIAKSIFCSQINPEEKVRQKLDEFMDVPMKNPDYYNIVLVGNTGAGKSTLINSILNGKFAITSDKPDPCTQGSTLYYTDKCPVRIWDTKGIEQGNPEEMINSVIKVIDNCVEKTPNDFIHAVCFCQNISENRLYGVVKNAISKLNNRYDQGNLPIVFVATNSDRAYNKDKTTFRKNVSEMLNISEGEASNHIAFTGYNPDTHEASGINELIEIIKIVSQPTIDIAYVKHIQVKLNNYFQSITKQALEKTEKYPWSSHDLVKCFNDIHDMSQNSANELISKILCAGITSSSRYFSNIFSIKPLNISPSNVLPLISDSKSKNVTETKTSNIIAKDLLNCYQNCIDKNINHAQLELEAVEKIREKIKNDRVKNAVNKDFKEVLDYQSKHRDYKKAKSDAIKLENEAKKIDNQCMADYFFDSKAAKVAFRASYVFLVPALIGKIVKEINVSNKKKDAEQAIDALQKLSAYEQEKNTTKESLYAKHLQRINNNTEHLEDEAYRKLRRGDTDAIKILKMVTDDFHKAIIDKNGKDISRVCLDNILIKRLNDIQTNYNTIIKASIDDKISKIVLAKDFAEDIYKKIKHEPMRERIQQDALYEKHSQIPTKAINNPTTSANTQVSICNNNDSVDPEHIYSNSEGVILTNVANGKKLNVHSAKNNENKI